jgi:hypothetical protein
MPNTNLRRTTSLKNEHVKSVRNTLTNATHYTCVVNLRYMFFNVTARSLVDVFPTTTINGVTSSRVCRNHGSYILTKFGGRNNNFCNIARRILQNHVNKSLKLLSCCETADMGWRMSVETLLTTLFLRLRICLLPEIHTVHGLPYIARLLL